MEYSYRFRRRLTKPPTPPPPALQPLLVIERIAPSRMDQVTASSDRR